MAERVVKGTIKRWSKEIKAGFKKDKTAFAQTGLQLVEEDDKTWHTFFGDNPSELEEFKAKAPVGSEVQFMEFNAEGSQYWNFMKGSFKVLKLGTGMAPVSKAQPTEQVSPEVWNAKDRRMARMNALNRSVDIWISEGKKIETGKEVGMILHLAEQFEEWIYNEKAKKELAAEDKKAGIPEHPTPIEEGVF